jgi:RNA polymerase sigma-70 factor (ECF subfamily)
MFAEVSAKRAALSDASESRADALLDRARRGDSEAGAALLDLHRARLRRMIAVRMDRRLSSRFDPSDVVQETLAVALKQLPEYLRNEPLPFYPWLRQIAWNRLVDLHRKHLKSASRSVGREQDAGWPLADRSERLLAKQLAGMTAAPGARMLQEELRNRVLAAMRALPDGLREVLVLRHLEELSVAEVAATLNISEGTVKSRHFRALAKLREVLQDPD